MNVSACLVTRGNVDMEPIVRSLPFDDIVVWDNSEQEDMGVYGRYAAMALALHPLIYVQDDDVMLPLYSLEELILAYEPGKIVANMPARFLPYYPDSCLVGFGALFERHLAAEAFQRFGSRLEQEAFNRTCDVVFTAQTPYKTLDLPYTSLPYANGPDRMYQQPGHSEERDRVLRLVKEHHGR